jgi:hypothetical protein
MENWIGAITKDTQGTLGLTQPSFANRALLSGHE